MTGSAFTAAEAAFVLREPIKQIKKAMDAGPVQAKLIPKAGGAVRAVEWMDLVYLFAVRALRDELTPKARNEFYHALRQSPVEDAREVCFGHLSIAIGDFKTELQGRTRELAELSEKIEFRSTGEAVLKGSGVEVHRIAALLNGGMSTEDICMDYPSLSPDGVAVAKAYADAHPKHGRPYPGTTAKRALRNAGLGALDEVLDGE
ncbi:DUF433 domain-containing protein [Methylobacterium indicum]|uniref:DUF433 domain-containing protein n=1 Tax=Methylobacterium indicum TaxID=1775910 RepID=A0A8H8WZZ3_9HYPH|nr:DUF433 domain-containing protein [Methylobacterium indicum]BCM87608.1 hypothetical protein mvi_60690 [Methylobacterium indicum]